MSLTDIIFSFGGQFNTDLPDSRLLSSAQAAVDPVNERRTFGSPIYRPSISQRYAQYLLGKLYLTGKGVQQDIDTAYQWFTKEYCGGHTYAGMFMDRIERGEQRPPSVMLAATRLLYHMGNIFRDNAPAPAATGVQIDRKRLAQLRQKRVALGHKPDDHEVEQQGYTMQFR